ncbi:MAG: nuclear transport factor 2 family protein [Actinomycetota bacterium]
MSEHAHPNVERARRGFEAFSTGDLTVLDELIDDDVVWHQGGKNALSGVYHGKQELLRLFVKLWEMTEGSMHTVIRDVWANDGYAVVITRTSAERYGRRQTDIVANVLRLGPDGRLLERWPVVDDQEAIDRFWS